MGNYSSRVNPIPTIIDSPICGKYRSGGRKVDGYIVCKKCFHLPGEHDLLAVFMPMFDEINLCHILQDFMISVSHISAGACHNMALLNDGMVRCWGSNGSKKCDVPHDIQNHVISISAGARHYMALLDDGTVRCWGYNALKQCDVPEDIQNRVISISAGGCHNMALLNDGTVRCWGFNWFKQCDVPEDIQNRVISISAGGSHSIIGRWNDQMLGI
jgi:alpha-tubulin suppressor-like RCC1 family protein